MTAVFLPYCSLDKRFQGQKTHRPWLNCIVMAKLLSLHTMPRYRRGILTCAWARFLYDARHGLPCLKPPGKQCLSL